uniref:Uncharacterized protein n=1 Tax=Triticum urartu TaxID=4572 RepID=A0A8R7QQU9_TRIUA
MGNFVVCSLGFHSMSWCSCFKLQSKLNNGSSCINWSNNIRLLPVSFGFVA